MLHSAVYNSFPRSWLDAYRQRDIEFFHSLISELSANMAQIDPNDAEFDSTASKLHLALALHDSLHSAGETCSFIMDIVNL